MFSTLTTMSSIPAFVLAPQAPMRLLPTPRLPLQLASPAPVALLAAPADRPRLAAPAATLALCPPLTAQQRFERDLVALLDSYGCPVELRPDRIGTPTLILNARTYRLLCKVTINAHDQTVIQFFGDGGERRYDFRPRSPVALHRLVVALTRRYVV